jgi:hypothetical protein
MTLLTFSPHHEDPTRVPIGSVVCLGDPDE